jgi:hypothetical protein
MEIDVNTVAWRKFKSQVKIEKVISKSRIEEIVRTVPFEWLGAIMRDAHWLVTEKRSFEKFYIDGFLDNRYIFVKYPEKQLNKKENEINMSTEITRSAEVIAQEINAIKSQTSGILEAAFTYAKRSCFEIGKRLEEAKAAVPFGEWGEWLEKNVSYSVSTANDLMRIYREFGNEQIDMLTGKSDAEIFEGLSQSQMVALFGLPKAMRAEFVEEHRDELESGEMSTRKMKEEIKRLNEVIEQKDKEIRDNDDSYGELVLQKKAIEAQMKDATERAVAAEAKASDLQLRIDELNERPLEATKVTETVYEASPEQIEEIRAAAIKETEDKHQEVEEGLRDNVKKLSEKYNKTKAALDAKDAELDAKIKEAVDAATAEAKKQVRQLTAQSDPRAAKVSYCLEAIGRAMTDINSVIAAMNSENAGSGDQLRMKCESALLGLVNKLGWQI